MSKKVGFILIVVLVAVAAVVGYFLYTPSESEKEIQQTLNAIPENAGLIIRVSNPFDKWDVIKSKGQFWKEVSGIPVVAKLDSQMFRFKKVFMANPKLRPLVMAEPAFLSLHMAGVNQCNMLFSFPCKDEKVLDEFQKMMNNGDSSIKVFTRNYEDVTIYQNSNSLNGEQYSIALTNSILVVSESPILVEDALRSIKHGSPLLRNTSFVKVFKAADPKADANIFINYQKLPDMLGLIVNKEFSKELKMFSGFGSWSESDVKIRPEGFSMTGCAYEPDSVNTYLKLFNDQKPQKIGVTNILPDNTSFFLNFGVEDFDKFRKGYRNYLSATKSLFDFEKDLASISAKYEIDVEEDIYSWMDKEVCLFLTQSNAENFKESAFLALHTSDIEQADAKLKDIQSKTNPAAELIEFQKFKIENLGITGLLPTIFGNLGSSVQNSYYIIVDEYVVFANEQGALKHFINSYLGGKILSKDVNFIQFMEQFSESSNIMTYLNFKKAGNLYKTFSHLDFYEDLEPHIDTIAKFEAFGYQLSSNGNLYNSNAYLKYNPKATQKSSSLVETHLDTTFSMRPIIVVNHLTKEKEIILQDDNFNLYLLNKAGEILWKKPIGEKILGVIHQVDCYRNNKLQYLFNTANKLCLVDRNGNDVKGFPVQFKSKASAGLTLLDYDKSKNYRIIVPFVNGKLLNFDINGGAVKGFDFSGMPAEIITPVEYFSFAQKDYLVVADVQGNVKVIGRRGEEKLKVKAKLPKSKNNNCAFIKASTFEKSAVVNTDEKGALHFLYFDGTSQKVVFNNYDASHKFYLFDVNKDGSDEVIFLDNNVVEVYKMNKSELFTLELGEVDTKNQLYFDFVKGETFRMGYSDYSKNKIFLIDNSGNSIDGFPMDASSPYVMEDLEADGAFEMIAGDNKGNLYIFPLQ